MKTMFAKGTVFVICLAVLQGLSGCGPSLRQSKSGETYYTKYNFHYYFSGRGDDMIASIVNYVNCPNHGFMPYNTKVKIGKYKKGFKLEVVDSGGSILVVAPAKYTGIKSREEYLDLILSDSPVSYSGLSEIDIKGISSGTPIEGMSKKGIMIALGYPAPAFTPNLESDVWHYWNSRFRKCNVHFTDGVVESVNKR